MAHRFTDCCAEESDRNSVTVNSSQCVWFNLIVAVLLFTIYLNVLNTVQPMQQA